MRRDDAALADMARSQAKRRGRECDDQRLTALILEVHTACPAYGALRVTHELQRQGVPVGRRIVARLMRRHGIAGTTRRKRRNPTRPDAGAAAVPDLIMRDFTAPMPGLKLVGDITCGRTTEGRLYLAMAVDLCSKEDGGYARAPHMRALGAARLPLREAKTVRPGRAVRSAACPHARAVRARSARRRARLRGAARPCP